MTLQIVAALKIVVLVALFGLLLASFLFEKKSSGETRRRFASAFELVALLAVMGYYNFGAFHTRQHRTLVQAHEQFHFFLGSKYLKELRYDGIYLATILAVQEDGDRVTNWILRDPMTFKVLPVNHFWPEARRVKARFSEERWNAFKADRRVFFGDLNITSDSLRDHGNTGSPSWAMFASIFSRTVGMSVPAANFYFFIDQALLLGLFVAIWRCFGARVACIAITLGLLPPNVFRFLAGSLLRLDWLFFLGMSACCLKVGRHKTAGALLGVAIASKVFCGLVALALGLRFVIDTVRTRRLHREHVALVLAAVVALGAVVVLSALLFGGFDIWADYWERLMVTYHEKYYAINHSFRDLFLQAAHAGPSVFDWTPTPIAAKLASVHIRDYTVSFLLARLTLLTAFLFVLARRETVFAFGVGVLFVFVMLVTNMYYWQMLLLIGLGCATRYREDPRKLLYLLFLCVYLIAQQVLMFVYLEDVARWQGYFGSYWLGLFCILILVVETAGFFPGLLKAVRVPVAWFRGFAAGRSSAEGRS